MTRNHEAAAANARIREADATARRKRKARVQELKLARREQRQAERHHHRAQRRDERQTRRANRKAAIRRFVSELPARAVVLPATAAMATAWIGQYDWALEGLHWSPLVAAAMATALESFGVSMAALARKARADGDNAVVERTAMWSVVITAALLNWAHSHQPVLAVMSIAGVVGWEVYERRRYRSVRLATGVLPARPARRPRFGAARWLRYFPWTFRAWSIAVRDRLTEAVPALDAAAAERNTFGGTWSQRRYLRKLAREFRRRNIRVAAPEEGSVPAQAVRLHSVPEIDAGTTSGTTAEPSKTKQPARVARSAVRPGHRRTPSARQHRSGSGSKRHRARAVFERYRSEGRLDELTGAVLAKQAGFSSGLGRRYLREWTSEIDSRASEEVTS